ncbi:hypothetical protein DH2020_035685 [Rehmannia glutinosa]|uniref:Polygalacturonase n=1 Tax=Rehmannia glutinosa TaxID=99300 RepID=A0ABR0V7M4_REHGL
MTTNPIFFILFLGLLSIFPHQSLANFETTYNVLDLGAKGDGKKDSTNALSKAWSLACSSTKSSTIYVPQGRFLLRSLHFKGPCHNKAITVRIDGTLVAPPDYNARNWLLFEGADGVSVIGGTLDGQGAALWACKKSGKNNCPSGATTLGIVKSKNMAIIGLTSLNSQMFHIVMNGIGSLGKDYEEAGVQNVTVKSVRFKNTQNGVRIKTWGDQAKVSGVKISHVTYQDIQGTSATQVAVKFDCSKGNPCQGIKLENVKLRYKDQKAEASCSNAAVGSDRTHKLFVLSKQNKN